MTLDDIRKSLTDVMKVRLPAEYRKGRPSKVPGDETRVPLTAMEKVEVIENHMALCAQGRAVAEEARYYAHEATNLLEDEWDQIEGWQQFMPGGKAVKSATQADIVEAKRQCRPELYTGIREGKRLVARLTEQIARLKQDEETASRLYTIVSD